MVRDALRRIGFEQGYGELTDEDVDAVTANWFVATQQRSA